jgi:ubiquinone/menaquinone biosynthesis C-methylase UbiE
LIGIAIDKGYIKSINQKVLDFFPDYAVKNCRKIRKNTKWLNITNIKICEHNFINIPYGNDFFDAVICTSRIHHAIINDIKKVVSEIYRVLNQKGYFIFDMISKEDEFLKVQKQINTNNI